MSAYPPPIENTPIFDSGLFLPPGTSTSNLAGNSSTAANLAGGAASQIPYQTALDNTAFIPNGTVGQLLTSQGSAAPTWTSPSLTNATNLAGGIASQIPYQSAASTTAFIANGTAGHVLTSNGISAPAFAAPAVPATATNLAGGIASQIPYQSALDNTAFIANGTVGQVLTSNGTSAPAFAAPAVPAGVASLTANNAFTNAENSFTNGAYQGLLWPSQLKMGNFPNDSEFAFITKEKVEVRTATNTTTIYPNELLLNNNANNTRINTDVAALTVFNAASSGVNTMKVDATGISAANVTNFLPIYTTPTYVGATANLPLKAMTFDPILSQGAQNSTPVNTITFTAIQLMKGVTYKGAFSVASNSGAAVNVYYGLYSIPSGGTSTLLASTLAIPIVSAGSAGLLLPQDYQAQYICTETGIYYAAILITGGACTFANASTTTITLLQNLGFTAVTGLLQKRTSRSTAVFSSGVLPNPTTAVITSSLQQTTWHGLY
jgi:hypothetical protein